MSVYTAKRAENGWKIFEKDVEKGFIEDGSVITYPRWKKPDAKETVNENTEPENLISAWTSPGK